MKVVYIIGPYRASNNFLIAENVRKAERVALKVWEMGAAALCPHLNTANFQFAAPDEVWLEGDKELLKRCDACVLADGWEKSAGSRAEIKYAESLGIPVFDSLEKLSIWLVEERREEEQAAEEATQGI